MVFEVEALCLVEEDLAEQITANLGKVLHNLVFTYARYSMEVPYCENAINSAISTYRLFTPPMRF